MAEYIEREALERHFMTKRRYLTKDLVMDAAYEVSKFPAADVVPVVRCKDCTYMEDAYVCNGFLICPASNMEITDNDYCSYGERKEADGNG